MRQGLRYRLTVRLGGLLATLVASLSLAACDTLARHGHGADGCNCYSDLYRDNPPMIGHGWKL